MGDKKEFVVISAGSSFKEPNGREEAEERIKALKTELIQGEALLRDPDPKHPSTGASLTTVERINFRGRLERVLEQKRSEIAYLRSWIELKGEKPLSAGQTKGETAFRLLWRCGQLLRRLADEGVEFTADEQKLIVDVSNFTGLKPDELLEEARACMGGGTENIFQFGGMIALATRDEKDLAILRAEWEKVSSQRPRNEVLVAKCAEAYTNVLAPLGRTEEAIAVVRNVVQTQRDAAYSWSRIAQHSSDPSIREHARELGRQFEPGQREWFFLGMYDMFGDPEDAKLATPTPDTQRLLGKKSGWHRVLLVKSHASWGRIAEAREAFRSLNSTEERIHALTYLAEFSDEAEDLDRLIASVAQYKPSKLNAMKRVAAVLGRKGQADMVVRMLEPMSTWYLKCGGYSVLAMNVKGRTAEMLDRAEQVVTSAQITGDTEETYALFSLVHAQAVNGRRAEALCTARIMKERAKRCMALLLLNAVARGEPIPTFIAENL